MDYGYIEYLIISTKEGNRISLEKLIDEFTPLIKKLSRTTFISNFTREDIEQECYLSLLKCIEKYNPKMHRFVGYATIGIKNNLNYLIRKNLNYKALNGEEALTSTGFIEDYNIAYGEAADAHIMLETKKKIFFEAMDTLTKEEKELLVYVNFKKNSLKSYAAMKRISYSSAYKKKIKIKEALKKCIREKENK